MARGDTKRRITDATLRLVAERGFEATPVTAIEAEAGLLPGNGSFYRHFATKEDALLAAVDAEIERVRPIAPDATGTEVAGDGAGVDALQDRFLADLAFLRELRPLILILARDGDRVPGVVASIRRTLLESGLLEYSALAGAPGSGPAGERAAAVGAVVLTSLVGYHLAAGYFGAPPGGIGPDAFARALAELVCADGRPGAPAPGR